MKQFVFANILFHLSLCLSISSSPLSLTLTPSLSHPPPPLCLGTILPQEEPISAPGTACTSTRRVQAMTPTSAHRPCPWESSATTLPIPWAGSVCGSSSLTSRKLAVAATPMLRAWQVKLIISHVYPSNSGIPGILKKILFWWKIPWKRLEFHFRSRKSLNYDLLSWYKGIIDWNFYPCP